ncbi:MAG: LysR family transcriptional regulator [Alphaproteobacteria bacterium]|nr:LysR family transcriptional regulator [Alphaproteobacteria bacterium]
MQLQQVRYVLEAARLLNFTRAAKVCGVSQPALTKAIRALEEELGGTLFHRDPTVVLTELGRRMLPLLEQTYSAAEAVRLQAESFRRKDVAPLALGFSPSVGADRLAPALAEIRRVLPGLQLSLDQAAEDQLHQALRDGTLDAAITDAPAGVNHPPEGLHWLPLGTEPCHIHAAPDHPVMTGETTPEAATDRIAFAAIADEHLPPARHRAATQAQAEVMVRLRLGWMAAPVPTFEATGPALPGVARLIQLVWAAGRPHSAAMGVLTRVLRIRPMLTRSLGD